MAAPHSIPKSIQIAESAPASSSANHWADSTPIPYYSRGTSGLLRILSLLSLA